MKIRYQASKTRERKRDDQAPGSEYWGFTGIPVADSDYIREIWIRIWVATYNAEISN